MNTENQRIDAAKLARQLGATQTLAVLNDDTKNSPIDAILQAAVEEVGLEKVIEVILESEYPYWALGALRYIPNLGDHATALREKAGLVFLPDAADAAAGRGLVLAANPTLPKINTFEMYMACGVGYAASFTMRYFTPPFNNNWIKSSKNSSNVPVCQKAVNKCDFFSVNEFPLKAGDIVEMVVDISLGSQSFPTGFQFIYDPTSNDRAQIDCHGTTLSPSFTFSVKKNS